MEDLSDAPCRIDFYRTIAGSLDFARDDRSRVFCGEIADADEPFGLENANDVAEMIVAERKERCAFTRRKFVRRPVASTDFDEGERAIIGDKVLGKKFLGRAETFGKQAPQSFAADFAAVTIKSRDGPLRMLVRRVVDLRLNAEPVAHGGDLAKWNTGLYHAKRPGIHAEKHYAFGSVSVTPQVKLMCAPGVLKRIVNVSNGQSEFQILNCVTQMLRGCN